MDKIWGALSVPTDGDGNAVIAAEAMASEAGVQSRAGAA